jgi:hypothetical protein
MPFQNSHQWTDTEIQITQAVQMLIDYAIVPPDIASRQQVDKLNAVHARLTARMVNQITIPEPGSGFRASNLIRIYLQAHMRRMLQLVEGAFVEFFDGRGVVAIMCARGLYESLATVTDFEKELVPLIRGGDLQKIFQFTKEKAHATKLEHLVEKLDNPNVRAKNVVTMVGKLSKIRQNVPREYDFLSEIAHPNGIGGINFFANMRNAEDVAYFSESGPDARADLQWIFVAAYFLSDFEAVVDRIEAELPALSARGVAERPKPSDAPNTSG